MKYLASEILEKAGVNVEETVGKVSVRIGGVVVNKPDHVINTQKETEVEVIVANEEPKTVQLEAQEKHSTAVKAVLKAKVPAVEAEAEAEAET
jgi:soluble P-type ATPase